MIITFSSGKNGWTEYVLNGTKTKPREEDLIEIIDGNLEITKKIYQSTNYKENYIRGVISFQGKIDIEKMKKVYEDFKENFFIGYDQEEYNISAVAHMDTENDHIHFCIPKLNLLTQQANQLYLDKLDRTRINALKEYLELKHFGGVGDITKTLNKLTKEDKTLDLLDIWREEHNQEPLKFGTKRELDKTTKIINNFILEQKKLGNINDFNSLQLALKSFDIDIVKIGTDTINNFNYITIQDPISLKKIRLKGEIYGADFWTSNKKNSSNRSTTDTRSREHKQDFNNTITNSYNRLQDINKIRIKYLESRFGKSRERARAKNRDFWANNTNDSIFISGCILDTNNTKTNLKEKNNENTNRKIITKEATNANIEQQRTQGTEYLIGRYRRTMVKTRNRIQQSRKELLGASREIQGIGTTISGGIHTMKNEIETFKEEISLTDFIIHNGGEIDSIKSCKNYDVINFKGDKLIVNKGKNGHYNYFNQGGSGGTIVDFYKCYIQDLPFGKIVGNLRKYHNKDKEYTYKKDRTTKDTINILREIDKLKIEIDTSYLLDFRRISRETYLIFKDTIREDINKNICFVHNHYRMLDNKKLDIEKCGIERKNKDFKGHYGEKGIWGKSVGDSNDIFIFESPFDAMAFYELHKKNGIYISTGGNISEEGINDILEICKYKNIEKVYYCLDNDSGGFLLKHRLNMYISLLPNLKSLEDITPKAKDFNEDLILKKKEENTKTIAPIKTVEREYDIPMPGYNRGVR